MFHVGQLVECVDDGRDRAPESNLSKGTIYTVTDVRGGDFRHWGTIEVLWLAEVYPPSGYCGFAGPCFRPLTDSRIAVFRQMLSPVPSKERELT